MEEWGILRDDVTFRKISFSVSMRDGVLEKLKNRVFVWQKAKTDYLNIEGRISKCGVVPHPPQLYPNGSFLSRSRSDQCGCCACSDDLLVVVPLKWVFLHV